MTATVLQVVALALGLAGAATWATVATTRGPITRIGWWAPAMGAVAVVLGTAAATAGLWAHDWWFAADRVEASLPLSLMALVWFGLSLLRDVRRAGSAARTHPSPATRTAAWAGCAASAAGLVTALAIGAPASPWAIGAVWLLVAGATAIVALAQAKTRSRRPLAAVIAGSAAVVIAAATAGIVAQSQPDPLVAAAHQHGASAAAATGEGPLQGYPGTGAATSVTDLRDTSTAKPDVETTVEARQTDMTLPSGNRIPVWSYGELGGPAIEATVGDTVQVTLRNRDIADGVTIHWHGYPVPNGDDGVAGVTQDAVPPGGSYTYRFVATVPGTYWYHTHQVSSTGVVRGLYGTFVVHPKQPEKGVDVTAALHTFGRTLVIGSTDRPDTRTVAPGTPVRVRLINTDQLTHTVTVSGTSFRVAAIDGSDVGSPTELKGESLKIPAGGRYDVVFTMPEGGARIDDAASAKTYLGFVARDGAQPPKAALSVKTFDPLSYGMGAYPAWTGKAFDVTDTLVLDRLPRLTEDGPRYAYTVDGAVYPQIPPTVVREGDTVELTIVNRGFDVHPMHPHGHRILVLSVDGRSPQAPLWLDSFDVLPGQVWKVAFVADNPGIWMDHCHNLEHAALGMVTHLAYVGVVSPFEHGGLARNDAE